MDLFLIRIGVASGNLSVSGCLLWSYSLCDSLDLGSIKNAGRDYFYGLAKLIHSIGYNRIAESVDVMRSLSDWNRVSGYRGGKGSNGAGDHSASCKRRVVCVRIAVGGGSAVHLLV